MLGIAEFDYSLPQHAIAQQPCEPRDAARLLDALSSDSMIHRRVHDLPSLVGAGDVIVVNDTRVLPARLALSKPTGGAVEVFLLDNAVPGNTAVDQPGSWRALVRPSRRVHPGTELLDVDGQPAVRVTDDLGDGVRVVTSLTDESLLDLAHRLGTVPLPPYITSGYDNADRYQTVYARRERSVAAPTAGLHLTNEVLDECIAAGATIERVELAVGLGTFRPIVVDDVQEHQMHAEHFIVEPRVLEACERARRVIAIGTTSVRALESAASLDQSQGSTELFISPGFDFKVVDVLFTNFHQPRSSLLVMLSAFAGPRWREIYGEALDEGYRFLSFGDAMIVARQDHAT